MCCVTHCGAVSAGVDAASEREGVGPRITQPRGVKQRHVPLLGLAAVRREVVACRVQQCTGRSQSTAMWPHLGKFASHRRCRAASAVMKCTDKTQLESRLPVVHRRQLPNNALVLPSPFGITARTAAVAPSMDVRCSKSGTTGKIDSRTAAGGYGGDMPSYRSGCAAALSIRQCRLRQN